MSQQRGGRSGDGRRKRGGRRSCRKPPPPLVVARFDIGFMFIRQSSRSFFVYVDLGSEVDSPARAVRLKIWSVMAVRHLVSGSLEYRIIGKRPRNVCVFSVLGMAVDTSTRPYAVFHSISTHWFRARRVFALFALGIIVIVSTCPVSGNLSGVSRRLKSARKLDFLGDDFQHFHILGCLVRQWIRMRQSWGPVEFLRAARCLTTASLPFVGAQCARSAFLVLDHGALAVGYGTARGNLGISSFSHQAGREVRPRHRPAPLTKRSLHFVTLSAPLSNIVRNRGMTSSNEYCRKTIVGLLPLLLSLSSFSSFSFHCSDSARKKRSFVSSWSASLTSTTSERRGTAAAT